MGITGKTASGKTSIANLILKNYQSKNIFFDDVEINEINKASIRQRVIYVPQNPVIFSGTIRRMCLSSIRKKMMKKFLIA